MRPSCVPEGRTFWPLTDPVTDYSRVVMIVIDYFQRVRQRLRIAGYRNVLLFFANDGLYFLKSTLFVKGSPMKSRRSKARFTTALACLLLVTFQSIAGGAKAYPGFNFYTNGNACYLKDMKGKTIHTWTSAYPVMSHAYLLRDSSVLFPYAVAGNTGITSEMPGGGFQIIKWDNTIAWNFTYYDTSFIPHHDCDYYYSTNNLAELPAIITIVATKEKTDGRISEKIVEIKPTGPTTADVIWQWYAYDHATSNGTDEPGLLDLTKGGESGYDGQWLHANSVQVNPKLNQLVIGLNWFKEFIVIDHSTTTAEAAAHSGGKYGKGGDILYRWGNPSNYGCPGTQYLDRPHGASWIPDYMPGTAKPLPGAGHVLTISNYTQKGFEIALPGTNGVYPRSPGSAFGPSTPAWTVGLPGIGADQGNLQRLPNGNTLACFGANGFNPGIYEYDSSGDTVWAMFVAANEALRYDSAYLGSTKLDTAGASPVIARVQASAAHCGAPSVCCKGFGDRQKFTVAGHGASPKECSVFTASGELVMRKTMRGNVFFWDKKDRPSGMYLMRVTGATGSIGATFFLSK